MARGPRILISGAGQRELHRRRFGGVECVTMSEPEQSTPSSNTFRSRRLPVDHVWDIGATLAFVEVAL